MGKAGKKPRQKMDPRKFEGAANSNSKKERDWTFEDIARSKPYRR